MCYKCREREALREAFFTMFKAETMREGPVDGTVLMLTNTLGVIYATMATAMKSAPVGAANDFHSLVARVNDHLHEKTVELIKEMDDATSPSGDEVHPTVR